MSNPIPRQEYIRSGTVESLNVTGENSKTIRWGATVTLMKVAG